MHIHIYHNGYFSDFNPGALRTLTVAKALSDGGHRVSIVSGDPSGTPVAARWADDYLTSNVVLIAGGRRQSGRFGARLPRRTDPTRHPLLVGPPPQHLILYAPTPPIARRVSRLAKTLGVDVTLDVTEWMGPRDFSIRSWLTGFPIRYEIYMRRLPRTASSAFAISCRMTSHLASQGGAILHVPPMHHPRVEAASGLESSDGDRVRVLVPGVRRSALGKDGWSLPLVAGALLEHPSLLKRVELHVLGENDDPVAVRYASELAAAGGHLVDHGKQPWRNAYAVLIASDWLVALRSDRSRRLRYGFPSKVTEALASGVPVIANPYSDIEDTVIEGATGVIVHGLTTDAVADALERALALQLSKKSVARHALGFTPSQRSAELCSFVGRVAGNPAD